MIRFPRVLLLLATLGLFAGCSEDNSPTAPSTVNNQADADDVAIQAGIAFDNIRTAVGASIGAAPSPIGFRSPWVIEGGFAADTTFTRGSITFELSRRWFDVSRVEQTVPDATTDSMVVGTRAFGTDSTTFASRYRVTVGHAGQLRIGGLVSTRSIGTIEGAAADTLDSRFTALSGGTRTFYARSLEVATGIQIPKTGGNAYPTTGTIQWLIHAQRTVNGNRGSVDKTLDATVTLHFNGTRFPTVTVNGAWNYVLDLDTGAVTRVGTA